MWAKNLLIAGFAVLSVSTGQLDQVRQAYTGEASLVPIQDRRDDRRDARSIRSLGEVADDVCQRRRGGDLISARLEDGPRPVYVLRCRMPNGEVRDFRVDASR
jgi:uncharacterized membrane protein YkoI